MKVIYKKDIIDKIIEEINRAKVCNRAIDTINLTFDEAKELIVLMNDARVSSYSLNPNFYIKSYAWSVGPDQLTEIEFKHNLDFTLIYRG